MEAKITLSLAELSALRRIAGTMMPTHAAQDMPGADDPAIVADIARSVGRDQALIRTALAEIDKRAGGAFASLDRERREGLINDWYAGGGPAAAALGRVVLSAYYRDDRVLRALGHEARAPFPQGHVVEQGDWSLLDPVKRRAAFWRDDRSGSPDRSGPPDRSAKPDDSGGR
jgi:hypothetical protein